MREIKFRVWDERENDMILWDRNEFRFMPIKNLSDNGFNEYFKIMQYTGLKDKNKEEIYEGDIVEDIYVGVCQVKCGVFNYEDEFGVCVMMSWFYLTNGKNNYGFGTDGDFEIEVIGNIYENKELLC